MTVLRSKLLPEVEEYKNRMTHFINMKGEEEDMSMLIEDWDKLNDFIKKGKLKKMSTMTHSERVYSMTNLHLTQCETCEKPAKWIFNERAWCKDYKND